MRRLLALALLPLLCMPGVAAPWQTQVTQPDDPVFFAFQLDQAGGAALVVECYKMMGDTGIWVVSGQAWNTRRDRETPLAAMFRVDGVDFPVFHATLRSFQGRRGLFVGPFADYAEFSALYNAVFQSRSRSRSPISAARPYSLRRASIAPWPQCSAAVICDLRLPDRRQAPNPAAPDFDPPCPDAARMPDALPC